MFLFLLSFFFIFLSLLLYFILIFFLIFSPQPVNSIKLFFCLQLICFYFFFCWFAIKFYFFLQLGDGFVNFIKYKWRQQMNLLKSIGYVRLMCEASFDVSLLIFLFFLFVFFVLLWNFIFIEVFFRDDDFSSFFEFLLPIFVFIWLQLMYGNRHLFFLFV